MTPNHTRNLGMADRLLRNMGHTLDLNKKAFLAPPPKLAPVSRGAYQSRIENIMELMGYDDALMVLSRPGEVATKLRRAYPSTATFVSYVTAVLAMFKMGGEALLKKVPVGAFQAWKQVHAIASETHRKQYSKREPTLKQLANYVSIRDMRRMVRELEKEDSYKTDFKTHMQWLFLQVNLHLKPKRADYGKVRVLLEGIHAREQALLDTQGVNYMIVGGDRPRLVLNTFSKTKKVYDRIVEPLPASLRENIRLSLRLFPRTYLFVSTRTQKPFDKPNTYVQFVRRTIFDDLFGKKTGVSLLRHAYINNLDLNAMSRAQREKVAQQMGHSVGMQSLYKWN